MYKSSLLIALLMFLVMPTFAQNVLIETYVDQTFTVNDEIPLFAVTGGVCGTLDFMGTKMTTQDYCGLRDKHQHPKEWVNVDGVHDYCFYTIEFH